MLERATAPSTTISASEQRLGNRAESELETAARRIEKKIKFSLKETRKCACVFLKTVTRFVFCSFFARFVAHCLF